MLMEQQMKNLGNPKDMECNLSIRVFPFNFYVVLDKMELQVQFSSNCLDNPYRMSFMEPW